MTGLKLIWHTRKTKKNLNTKTDEAKLPVLVNHPILDRCVLANEQNQQNFIFFPSLVNTVQLVAASNMMCCI